MKPPWTSGFWYSQLDAPMITTTEDSDRTAVIRHEGKWRSVTRSHACPICQKPDWCRVSTDGRKAACRRVSVGAYRTKLDKSGGTVYLHRLDGAHTWPTP